MAREKRLVSDLANLAEKERGRLGEPPTIEQLTALRDGELAEGEADRLRSRLAVDPESAALYLELKRFQVVEASADQEIPGFDTAADVDDAWRELSTKLGQDQRSNVVSEYRSYRVVPFSRRTTLRLLLGLAAMLVVGLGIGWLFEQPSRHLPKGGYYEVAVTGEKLRDPRLLIPSGMVGLEFQIEVPDPTGRFAVELLDVKNEIVGDYREEFESGQESIIFRVSLHDLVGDATYRLQVRRPGEALGESLLSFIPVLPD